MHGTVSVRDQYHLPEAAEPFFKRSAFVGVLGVVLAFGFSFLTRQGMASFLYAYLMDFCYFLSLSLGALFFILVQHLTRAGWSVALRRVAEVFAAAIPFWALLFLPILLLVLVGNGSLYSWNAAEVVQNDPVLLRKLPYLNAPFFLVRALLYFGVWSLVARWYWSTSVRQDDTGDKSLTQKMQSWSGPALVAFAFTVTFAAFDWLMSLDPHWFSTIYGVYFFAGCAVGFFAALALTLMLLQQAGLLTQSITVEHYHDLGKWLFGFVFFWGYIAFSQYMLIWYANIPEETRWYAVRQRGGWIVVSLLLLFGHFLIPFAGLLSRHVKRDKRGLAFWAVILLIMHWVDLYYLVMPQLYGGSPSFGLVDIFCVVGMGGLYVSLLTRVAGERGLLPVRDPRLSESLAFKNA